MLPTKQENSLRLEVKGLGHVPAFKNNKMIARGRLITNPKRQRWMEKCRESFVSQWLFANRTTTGEMPMGLYLPSLIACSLPEDDSSKFIPELKISVEQVPKGEEGALIIIEPL